MQPAQFPVVQIQTEIGTHTYIYVVSYGELKNSTKVFKKSKALYVFRKKIPKKNLRNLVKNTLQI